MYFGVAGSNNDINILDNSTLLHDLMHGRAPQADFQVNNNNYKFGYYLTDGIYPDYAIFVKTLPAPSSEKRKYFVERQEGERKEVERGFCALQVSTAVFFFI